jgi:hypothetical protein
MNRALAFSIVLVCAVSAWVAVAAAQGQFNPNRTPNVAVPAPPAGGVMAAPTIQVMPRATGTQKGSARKKRATTHRWPKRKPECWQEYYTGIVHCRTPPRAANPNRDTLPRPTIPTKQGLQVRVPLEQ